jgi:hypothetical protein
MFKKALLIIGILPLIILLPSCSGLDKIPLIPESVRDQIGRDTSVLIDEVVQKFQEDGVTVWFYPRQMRVVIEVEPKDHSESK